MTTRGIPAAAVLAGGVSSHAARASKLTPEQVRASQSELERLATYLEELPSMRGSVAPHEIGIVIGQLRGAIDVAIRTIRHQTRGGSR